MKKLIFILLCAGCAGNQMPEVKPEAPVPCPTVVPAPTCSDQLTVLDVESLTKGFTCSSNSRLIFPLSYHHSDKVLILCQCK